MALSVHSSTTSPFLRQSLRGPVARVLIGTLVFLMAVPAVAAPKKKKKGGDEPAEIAPGGEAAPAKPSAQESDKERPKTILSADLVAPPKDTLGRVHFASPKAANTGRVVVKGPAEGKIQVFLDGRYFGTAPVTIHSVPRGDYIVEGNFPEGKNVTKPVSVVENEAATIELAPTPEAAPLPTRPAMFDAEMTPKRQQAAKILAISGAGVIVLGGIFGYLKYSKEKEYSEPGKSQAQLDDIAATGRRYSVIANLSFALGGAALLGAAFAAYPMVFGTGEKAADPATTPPKTTFMLVPGPGYATGSVAWTF